MDFQVGEEQPLPGVGEQLTAMTQVIQRAFTLAKYRISNYSYFKHNITCKFDCSL